jgi:hypothetical protein
MRVSVWARAGAVPGFMRDETLSLLPDAMDVILAVNARA